MIQELLKLYIYLGRLTLKLNIIPDSENSLYSQENRMFQTVKNVTDL